MTAQPSPVTAQRLREIATRTGTYVRDHPRGAVTQSGGLSQNVVVHKNVLIIRTQWPRVLPAAALGSVRQVVNDWNRDRMLPTLSTRTSEDGVQVVAMCTIAVRAGLTDQQLRETLERSQRAIGSAMQALAGSIV